MQLQEYIIIPSVPIAKYSKYIDFQHVGECPKQTSITCSKPGAVTSGYRGMAGLICSLLQIRKNILIKSKYFDKE